MESQSANLGRALWVGTLAEQASDTMRIRARYYRSGTLPQGCAMLAGSLCESFVAHSRYKWLNSARSAPSALDGCSTLRGTVVTECGRR